jgi:hypothetical protein
MPFSHHGSVIHTTSLVNGGRDISEVNYLAVNFWKNVAVLFDNTSFSYMKEF